MSDSAGESKVSFSSTAFTFSPLSSNGQSSSFL